MISAEVIGRIIQNLNALRGLTKLGNLSTVENDILLLQNSWRVLKDFYKKVFDSEQPLNATIQQFVGNKTFLSSQYFQGHFVSTIPIAPETFFKPAFFKPAFFKSQSLYDDQSAFQRTCLRNLVAGNDVSEFNWFCCNLYQFRL